jgi:hypothetical protein
MRGLRAALLVGVSIGIVSLVGGCAHQASTAAGPTAQTPYQKAATVMLDFSADLATAQQTVMTLQTGGALDRATYKTVQAIFGQIAVYGPQIDALIAAQASSATITAKVQSTLIALDAVVSSTSGIDPNTANQIKVGIQAMSLLLNQVTAVFNSGGTALVLPPTMNIEVVYGSGNHRSTGGAGSSARHPDLPADRGVSARGWNAREVAGRHPRGSRRELRQGGGSFAAVAV